MKETATRIRKVEELIGLMQKNLECSICLDLLKNPVSTKCDHQFCRFCITEFLHKKSSVPCPLCKKPVTRRSLSERPKLGDIVSGIRRLMTAFHTDQESSANPSQSSQSGLPSSTAVTVQSASAGCFKRSLEQPNSASIQNDKSLRNLRQSKRRKTEVTHVFIDDLTEAADLVQTHVNVSGGFPASRVHGKKCAKKGNVASRKVKQSNSDGELTSLPNPTEQADDGEGSCEVELVRYLVEASCGAHSSSSNVTTQRLEEEDQDESDGGSVCRGSYEEEESVQSESNCKEFGDCATEDRDDTHDIVHEDVVMLEKGDVSGHAKPENNHDQNPKHGPGEEKHTCSNENTKLNAKQSNDLCDLADSLDYGFMEEKFGTVSQTGSVPGSQPPKVTKPISIGTNVSAKSSVPSGDLEISVPTLDKSKSCRTYATRQKIKKVSNWMYNLPPSVGKNSVNSGCTSEPSVSTGALKKSDLALEGNVESESTTKRPLLARRIFKSRQLCAVKRSKPPREEITDPSAEDDPYVFKSSQRTPKRGKNQKGRKGGKRASRGRVKQRAKDRKPQLCVVQMEKTDASVTSDNQATTPQVVLETQPFEINGNPDEDVLNGEEECESMQIRRQTSDKVSPKAMGEVGGAVSGEVSGVSDSDSSVIPPSVFVPPQRRVLRSSRPQQPLILNTDSCAEGKKMGKQRKNRKLEVEAKKQADQRDMDKLISKISQAESFELLFSSQDVHKQMTAETRKKSQRSTEDRAVQESEASDEGGSSSQDIIKDTLETNAQLESTKGPGDPKTKCSSVPPKKVISYELQSIASRQSASSPKNLTHILPSADVIAPTLSKMGKLLKSVQVKRKTPSASASPDLLSKRPAVSDFVGETSEDSSVSIISPTGQPGQLAKASTPPTQVSPSNQTGEVYHSSGVYSKVAEDENKPVPSSYNMQKPTNLQDATEAPATSPGLLFCTEDSDSSSTEDLDIHPTSDEYAIPAPGNVHTMSTKSVAETSSQWLPAVEEAIVDEDTSTEAQEIPHLSSHPVTDVSTRLEQDTAAVQSGIHQGGIRDDAQGKVDSIQSVSENCVPESPLVLDGDSAPNRPTPTHENSTPVVGTDSVDLGATADKLKTKNDDDFLQTGNVAVAEDSPKEVHYACVGQDGRGTEMEDKRNENRDMDTPVGEATVAIKSQSDDGSARNTQELKSGDNIFDSDVDLRLVSESCGGSLSKSCHEMESLTVVPPSLVEGLDEEPKLKQVSLENKSTGSVVGVQSSTGHSDSSPKNTHQKMSSAVVESSSGFVSVTPGASVEVVHPIRTSFNCARNALSKTTTDETASPKSAEFPVILPLSDDRPLCSMRTKSFRRRSPRVSYENLALFSQTPTQLKSGASNSDGTVPQSLDDCTFQEGSGDKPQSNNSQPLASGVVNENPDWSQNKNLPSSTAKDKDEPADPQATLSPQKEDDEDEGLNGNAVDACTEETLPPSVDLDDLSGSGIHPSSLTEPQSSVVLVQDSARVIPCSLEPPVSSAQVSAMRPSRKRTRRSAKQEAKNSDSDSELKEEEPLIRRVKRTRSQRNLVNGSGSFLFDSSISQSILTEPKTKAQGKSQTAENPPEPTQICEDTLREQSPESRTSSAKTKGAHLDDSLVLIKNLVKTQALKAKMSKGKVDSPSSSVVGRPCQNTSTASQCPDKVKKFTPAVVCDHEEDFGEGRKGKEDDLRALRSSAQLRDDDSKCSQRNESQPYETAKVGTRKKNRFTDGQGVKDTCDNLNAATTEGGKQCSPDVVLGSGEIPHLGPGQSPVEEVSEKSEKLRRSGRRRRGKVIKPVIVDTDSDSDSPFELTDAAEIEDQEDLPELEVTKDPKPESSQQAQVCFDREQNEGNDGSKPKKKPVRPVISDDSDDPDDDDDIVKLGDAEAEDCSQDNKSANLTSSSAFSSQSELLCTQQRSKLEQDVERMKQEIEALEAQLAAEDSALLESTVREANVTLETSHLESIVSKPSEVEMETSNADLTVKEPGDVETETNDDDITVREPCEVDNETSKAGMTVGDHIEVEMETSDDDITVREPCEVDSETSKAGMTVGDHIEVEMEANDVESSVIGPSNPDDIHKTGVCGLKRKPERMPTSLKTCPLEEEKCSPSREEDLTNEVPPTDATEIDIQCISSSQESEDLFLSPRSPSPPPSLPDTNIKPSAVSQVVLKLKEIFKAVSPGHCGNSPNKYRGLSPDSAKSTPPCSPRSERPLVSAQKSIYKDPTSDTSLASPAGSRVKAGLPKPFQSPAFTGVLQGKGSRFRTPQRSNVMSPLGRTTPSGDGKSSSRRLCFVTTGLHLSQAQRTQKLAQMFNIKIQPKFSPAATHVIVKTVSEDSLVCERTFKYFQAIAHHCWLISYQWVEDCITANEILPETGYEIQGDTVSGPKHRGPRRSRLYNNPVFADFEFFCHGDSPNLPPGEFQNLLTVSGGTVVTSPDALGVDPEKTQLILDLNEDQHPSNIRLFDRLYRKYGVVTVSREWVFDTITQYKVQPLPPYVLTSLPNIELPFV